MISQRSSSAREIAGDAWRTLQGISRAAWRRLTWRESLQNLRKIVWEGLLERLVGIVVLAAVVAVLGIFVWAIFTLTKK